MLGGGHSIGITVNIDDGPKEIQPEFKTMFWSIEKMTWLQTKNFPNLPTNFSMISGCSVALNRNIVLLIGGQHNWQNTLQTNVQPKQYFTHKSFPNNQVLQYNLQNQTWTWLENIPYEKVSKQNAKMNSLFKIHTF